MKEILKPCTLLIMQLIGFCFSFSAQAATYNLNQPSGTISVLGNLYVDDMNNTWNLNVQEARPVRINYTIDVENNYDKVQIFAVSADNLTTTLVVTLTGSTNGTISTTLPTGKVQVVFTSDGSVSYTSGYIGINLYFSTDNSTSTYTSGNSIINGNLGIGTLNPTSKLHISNKSSLSGLGGAYISVIQKQPNATATGDGGLSVEYSLTAASATNELGFAAANMRSNNYLTAGGVVQYQRVLQLSSGSSTGSTTTNLDMIRIEPGGSSGTTTNAYGLNIVSLPGTNKWGIYDQSGSNWYASGKMGIGATSPKGRLNTLALANSVSMTLGSSTQPGLSVTSSDGGAYGMYFGVSSTGRSWIQGGRTDSATAYDILLQSAGGKVGIGTNSPDELLTVNGIIHAKEVKIDLSGPLADFVFKKGYALRPLNEVHSYIKDNGHLPEIPSEEEVKKNGMNISEMQVKLLQKVEELTLYAIDQQKRIEELEKELRQVKNKQ